MDFPIKNGDFTLNMLGFPLDMLQFWQLKTDDGKLHQPSRIFQRRNVRFLKSLLVVVNSG